MPPSFIDSPHVGLEALRAITERVPAPSSAAFELDWVAEGLDFGPLCASLANFDPVSDRDPVIRSAPAASIEQLLPRHLPDHGTSLAEVYTALHSVVVGFARRNAHPGFWAYICGSGLPTDPGAHAWVAALNQNVTSQGSAPGAVVMERSLIRWFCDLVGWGEEAGGLLVSGGSMANLSALASALYGASGCERAREDGWAAIAPNLRPRVYASQDAHFSILRAMRLLGLGASSLQTIALDRQSRIDVAALEEAIGNDRRAGRNPVCVAATAGSTTTGAVDPLDELAALCCKEKLTLHVDAAYGGGVLFSPTLRSKLIGIEHADSVVIDLHKWGFASFDASLLLYRTPARARVAFAIRADYAAIGNAASDEEFSFFHHGIETSRRARALPVVVALMRYGRAAFASWIDHAVELTRYLRNIIDEHPQLEWVAGGDLSILCFRYRPMDLSLDVKKVDAIQSSIVLALRAEGNFLISASTHEGRPILRVCIVNTSCRASHMVAFAGDVLRLGALAASMVDSLETRISEH